MPYHTRLIEKETPCVAVIESLSSAPVAQFSGPASDPLDALRCATSALHECLDRRLLLAQRGASLIDYARHLLAVRAWLQALSPWLDRVALAPVPLLKRIELDLIDCAIPRLAGLHPACGGAVRAASDGSAAFCWGVAYVVEGSALGGQVLHRRLRSALAPHPLRYLAGDGEQTAARWKQFLTQLRAQVLAPHQVRAACAGGVAAFEEFALSMRLTEGAS